MLAPTTDTTDTIVAVSSPPGRSPRGLVRLTGPDAPTIAAALTDTPLPPPRTLTPTRLRPPLPPLSALLVRFAAPHSYTGQHVVELQLPGHPALLEQLVHAALAAGARLAEPGEFTFRGYLADRFDLTQAEGIAATIAATSDSQLQAATLLREGRLGSFAGDLVDALGTALALVEAGIDFIDQDDVVPIAPAALDDQLATVEARLAQLLERSRAWGELEALPRVVLVGPPSAGKSTLFNALLGRQRAVTSATPGTTRDVLVEPMTLRDGRGRRVEVMLVDLAGLDAPTAALDEQVQAAAQAAVRRADLVVRVHDVTRPVVPPRVDLPARAPVLDVHAKADLVGPDRRPREGLSVSARTGEGLDTLRDAIARRVGEGGVSLGGDMLALQPRHADALGRALDQLRQARALLAPQRDRDSLDHMELIAGHLRHALDDLAGLGGQLTPDDVIGRIFATFCVGK